MDVSDASYYIFNEKGNKGSQKGTPKKKKENDQTFLPNVNRRKLSKRLIRL
jgi:hypothetical protein